MFTIKATYRSETRKFSFTESSRFPTYDQLYQQLYRIFPISNSYYLSRLLFTQSPSNPSSRILIGMEAHNEHEYNAHVRPYGNKEYPGALLRFSVFDETPHKLPAPVFASPAGTNTTLPDSVPPLQFEDPTQRDNAEVRRRAGHSHLPYHGAHHSRANAHSRHDGHRDPQMRPDGPRSSWPSYLSPPPPPILHLPSSSSHGHYVPPPPPIPPPPHRHLPHRPPVPSMYSIRQDSENFLREVLHRPSSPPRFMPLGLAQNFAEGDITSPSASERHDRPPPGTRRARRHWHAPSFLTSPEEASRADDPHGDGPAPPTASDTASIRTPSAVSLNLAQLSAPHSAGSSPVAAAPPPPPHPRQAFPTWNAPPDHNWSPPIADDELWTLPAYGIPPRRDDSLSKRPSADLREIARKVSLMKLKALSSRSSEASSCAVDAIVKDEPKGKGKAMEGSMDTDKEDKVTGRSEAIPESVRQELDRIEAESEKYAFSGFAGPDLVRPTRAQDRDVLADIRVDPPVDNQENIAPPVDAATGKACCDVNKGKEEVREMINGFMKNLDKMMSDTFSDVDAPVRDAAPTPTAASAFTSSTSSSASTQAQTDKPLPVHRNVLCDVCDKTVVGTRHKCLDCPDYDLCPACYVSNRHLHHQGHEFFGIDEPGHVYVHTVFSGDKRGSRARPSLRVPGQRDGLSPSACTRGRATAGAQADVVHNASCDLCDSRIQGIRWKCLNCPDFDTCASCFTIVPIQHPGHSFVRVQTAQDLAYYRNPNVHPTPAMSGGIEFGIGLRNAPAKHRARCDGCQNLITGIRYKCMHLSCPDYDLCASCEAMPIPVHPSTHPLLKIKEPGVTIPRVIRAGPIEAPQPVSAPVEAVESATAPKLEVSHDGEMLEAKFDLDHCDFILRMAHAQSSDEAAKGSRKLFELECSLDGTLIDWKVDGHSNVVEGTSVPAPVQQSPPHSPAATFVPVVPVVEDALVPAPGPVLIGNERAASDVDTSRPRSLFTDDASTVAPVATTNLPSHEPESFLLSGYPVEPALLRASFIQDNNIPDGQVFPPGAEFVKSWRVRNEGSRAWPEETRLVFVAGDAMMDLSNGSARTGRKVGSVLPGVEVDVWTGELKAPELPGKYMGYWKLCDGEGKQFGHSIWVEIVVSEPQKSASENGEEGSLAASSVIMPHSAPDRSRASTLTSTLNVALQDEATTAPPTQRSVTMSDGGSDLSMIDIPSSDEELDGDEAFEDSRSFFGARLSPAQTTLNHTEALTVGTPEDEYVVLYDSSDEE